MGRHSTGQGKGISVSSRTREPENVGWKDARGAPLRRDQSRRPSKEMTALNHNLNNILIPHFNVIAFLCRAVPLFCALESILLRCQRVCGPMQIKTSAPD